MTDTIQILITDRTDRSVATAWMNRCGIPQNDRTYYSRTDALDTFGNDDARYVVTTDVDTSVLCRQLGRRGISVEGG